jgi:hypothetical protein
MDGVDSGVEKLTPGPFGTGQIAVRDGDLAALQYRRRLTVQENGGVRCVSSRVAE